MRFRVWLSSLIGMKRKLSVGIALIANSKVVILDEPTSGTHSSPSIEHCYHVGLLQEWIPLLDDRLGKCFNAFVWIVRFYSPLTSWMKRIFWAIEYVQPLPLGSCAFERFLQIAIMGNGRMRCFGSPFFLKTNYGKKTESTCHSHCTYFHHLFSRCWLSFDSIQRCSF